MRLPGLVSEAATKVLIKGAGEHASGTAHRLFKCGFKVVMTEIPRPTAVRRRVSFCSAVLHGTMEVEGVEARLHEMPRSREEGRLLDEACVSHVPVLVDPEAKVRELWRPGVVIDARIMKRNLDTSIDDASLVIGYGPGFTAGRDVHAVVETMRGHDLGRIVLDGPASPNTGVPGPIGGESERRLLSAPASGRLRAHRDIGDMVDAGDLVCEVGGEELRARIPGVLRGLVVDGLEVHAGQKIGDIDPRGIRGHCFTISEKARCISGAALELVIEACRMGSRGDAPVGKEVC